MPTEDEWKNLEGSGADMVTFAPINQLDQLAGALAKAQAVMAGAEKEGQSNFGKYATLASVWDACRGPLTENGLSVVQMPGRGADGLVTVTTLLLHVSGQRLESTVGARPVKDDAQGLGSVITYLRRYALAAMVGVCPEDDDGEAAVGRGVQQPAAKRPAATRVRTVVEPEPRGAGSLAEEKRRALEGAISACAKAFGQEHAAFRQTVKDKCGTHYGVEHFKDLAPDQYETVMKWLGQETRKAQAGSPDAH